MEFFNKKEEVLDVQLTEYGKYLLSQGRMKPVYYAFYDDEILYDVSASGDVTELQKGADRRIRYETPNLKAQASTTGVETRVRQFLKAVETNINKKGLTANSIDFADAFENVPQFGQKFFAAADPLGTSDLKSDYAPAWGVNLLNNEISSSDDYYTVNLTSSAATVNNGVIKEIPQINVVIDYKSFYTEDILSEGDFEVLTQANAQGINIAVEKNYLLIDLQEENTVYEKDNFFCEVFISGSDEGLRPLFYRKDVLTKGSCMDEVAHYLELSLDGEIPINVSEKYGIVEKAITHNGPLVPGKPPPGARLEAARAGDRLDVEGDLYDFGGDLLGVPTEDEEPCD